MKKKRLHYCNCLFLFCFTFWAVPSLAQPVSGNKSALNPQWGGATAIVNYSNFQRVIYENDSRTHNVYNINTLGFGIYFGLSGNVDLGLQVGMDIRKEYKKLRNVNLNLKINFIRDRLAATIGIGVVSHDFVFGHYINPEASFYPHGTGLLGIIYRQQLGNNIDLNLTNSLGANFGRGAPGTIEYGLLLSPGFSSDLAKWAIRPEVGFKYYGSTKVSQKVFWNLGVALDFRFFITSKKVRAERKNKIFPNDFYKNK